MFTWIGDSLTFSLKCDLITPCRFVLVDVGWTQTQIWLHAISPAVWSELIGYSPRRCFEYSVSCVAGGANWQAVLEGFWGPFNKSVLAAKEVPTRDVIDMIDATLGSHFFSYQVLTSITFLKDVPLFQNTRFFTQPCANSSRKTCYSQFHQSPTGV